MSTVSLLRRSFLARLGHGVGLSLGLGALAGTTRTSDAAAAAAERTTTATDWQPARHDEDDWYDQPGAKHRLFIDTTEPGTFGQAIAWGRNFLEASSSGYHLTDADTALIICARHDSTPFAYTDAMWAKYGAVLAERSNFVDPKSKQPPTVNVY